MKGVVFTEFLDMVDEMFGPEILEEIIEESDLKTGGAYTAVGTYDHAEIFQLVTQLGKQVDKDEADLVRTFGEHLFGRLAIAYPKFAEGVNSSLDFISNVESYIHPEVRKLYPDAELPRFEFDRVENDKLIVTYQSPRGLGALAEGLMIGCARHFKETLTIESEDLSGGDGTHIRFTLVRSLSHGRDGADQAAA